MKVRYALILEVEGELSRDDKRWLADHLSLAACDLMCEVNDGDSGGVAVKFVT